MKEISLNDFKKNIDNYCSEAIDQPIKIIDTDADNTLFLTSALDAREIMGEWVKEFLAIPAEFRVNPFIYSEDGDLYWADKRNVDEILKYKVKK